MQLDVKKLEFKKEFEEAGSIHIWIDGLKKLVPITRENLLLSISKGYHHDKLKTFFTLESIQMAKEEPKTKKTKNDEGNN